MTLTNQEQRRHQDPTPNRRRLSWMVVWLSAITLLFAGTGCDNGNGSDRSEQSAEASANGQDMAESSSRTIELQSIADIRDSEGNRLQRPTLGPEDIVRENDVDQLLGFLYWEREPDWRNESGFTLLVLASAAGSVELVEELIRYGADVNATVRMDMTALHWAARTDQLEVARVLLENGANPNATGGPDRSLTPMDVAANRGHREFVQLLAQFGGMPHSVGGP